MPRPWKDHARFACSARTARKFRRTYPDGSRYPLRRRDARGEFRLSGSLGRQSLLRAGARSSQAEREIPPSKFHRGGTAAVSCSIPSMIVNNFNILWPLVGPDKTDTPLIVHPNAPLTGSVAGEFFKPVARRRTKVLDAVSSVKLRELAHQYSSYLHPFRWARFRFEKYSRSSIRKGLDHPKPHLNTMHQIIRDTYRILFLSSRTLHA